MKQIQLNLPANWQEIIRAGKFADVIRVLNTAFGDEATGRMAMLETLTGFSGFDLGQPLGKKQRAKAAEGIDNFEAMQIIDKVFPCLDFIYDTEPYPLYDNPGDEGRRLLSYECPVPQFTLNGIVYRGPSIRLHDQTAEEWMITHQALAKYAQTKALTHLRIAIAVNYHAVTDGLRGTFSEEAIMQKADAFVEVPEETIIAIYLWYRSADAWWFEKFASVFTGEGGAAATGEGLEVRDIVFELAGNSMGADWDTVKRRTRQDIFYALDRLEQKRRDWEEKNK